MKKPAELLKEYLNLKGVKISIIASLFAIFMLIISLVGIKIENKTMEGLSFLSLIAGFFYGVTVTFLILKKKEEYIHLTAFLFLNWFIGCFCTNVFINIFENLPIWVYVVTFLFCVSNFFIYGRFQDKYITPLFYFINGFSFLLIFYYTVYLIPIMPISFIGILGLGLGFYGLVPIIVVISHTYTLMNRLSGSKINKLAFGSGIGIVLISFVIFTIQLNRETSRINQNSITKVFDNEKDDLPTYIRTSQNLSPNFFNEILLKKDIVYVTKDNFFEFRNFNSFGTKQYNERKTHNPFYNLAFLFTPDLELSVDDQINILKSNFDKRLETEEQLWSGTELFTKNIKEDVKIYPNSRLAYSEITIDIACKEQTWNPQEAIYSFQLPEGSVATSLSLWVNGIERKGVLTTKEKAQAAYTKIVGVEQRDPSLMQWREGNKVVVRVFPIQFDLPRTFKCGFTTPLKVVGDKMNYESLKIKGPNISQAAMLSRIQVEGQKPFESSKDFELTDNYYINSSTGLDEWNAELTLVPTQQTSFKWKDKTYEVSAIEKETEIFVPSEVVLDLTQNWTSEEIESILKVKDRKYVVVKNYQKKEITLDNFKTIVKEYKTLHYSLLPLYLLKENSLIITKNGNFSANFEELATSDYLQKIKAQVRQKGLKAINLSEEINPFWQTLKEQNFVDYYDTDLQNCLQLIKENKYISFKESENAVNIDPAKVSIVETAEGSLTKSNGPDHIYRMYAFGKVLKEHVDHQEDSLQLNRYVDLAKDANIVTPISSLIVLETDEDYKNNGIEKNVNTLGNASINNDGSVPEPHEWAMIIISLMALLYFYRKR
ncbi:MAG: XrtN system VIT domain-containing protein [Flavobacteriales bacterium]|nr:XrtN system VIT domain-containing protein [Flavobacteriales bacterium]